MPPAPYELWFRQAKCFIDCPTRPMDTAFDCAAIEAKMTTSISKAHALSVHYSPDIAALIPCLIEGASPSTVIREISKRGVNAINRISAYWLKPHIGKEQLKVMPPSTNCYPDAAIPGKMRDSWVLTPRQHILPRSIFGGDNMNSFMSMLIHRMNVPQWFAHGNP